MLYQYCHLSTKEARRRARDWFRSQPDTLRNGVGDSDEDVHNYLLDYHGPFDTNLFTRHGEYQSGPDPDLRTLRVTVSLGGNTPEFAFTMNWRPDPNQGEWEMAKAAFEHAYSKGHVRLDCEVVESRKPETISIEGEWQDIDGPLPPEQDTFYKHFAPDQKFSIKRNLENFDPNNPHLNEDEG